MSDWQLDPLRDYAKIVARMEKERKLLGDKRDKIEKELASSVERAHTRRDAAIAEAEQRLASDRRDLEAHKAKETEKLVAVLAGHQRTFNDRTETLKGLGVATKGHLTVTGLEHMIQEALSSPFGPSPEAHPSTWFEERLDALVSDVDTLGTLSDQLLEARRRAASRGRMITVGIVVTIATLGVGGLLLWRYLNTMAPMEHVAEVRSLAFSADGQWLYSADKNGTVRSWDADTGERGLDLKASGNSLTLAASPGLIAAGGDNGRVHVWELDGTPRYEVSHAGKIFALAFSNHASTSGGALAVAGSGPAIDRLDAETGERREPLVGAWGGNDGGRAEWVRSLAFAPAGRELAAGFTRGWVRMFADGETASYREHSGQVRALAYMPDDTHLVSAGGKSVVFFSTARREVEAERQFIAPVTDLAISEDSKTVFVALANGNIARLDSPSYQETGERSEMNLKDNTRVSLAIHPDGKRLALSRHTVIQIIPVPKEKENQR